MKDEQQRIQENQQRAAQGKPQIPGSAQREAAATLNPLGQ